MAHSYAHDGTYKICVTCKLPKLLEEFSCRNDRGGGRQSKCKQCANEAYKLWYRNNHAEQLARRKAYVPSPEAAERKRVWDRTHSVRDDEALRQHRRRESTRRARKLNQFIEDVDPAVVYVMHGGMCGICEDFVPQDDFHVDHVLPLARGGMHGYVNVQPAHPECNLRKGARV